MAHYASPVRVGLSRVKSAGDGYTITIQWHQAYPDNIHNQIAYHIYYGTHANKVITGGEEPNIFYEGVKLVIIDGSLEANVIDLTPGSEYWFCVRPVEYDPTVFDLSLLPIAYDNVRFYPSSLLRRGMSATDLIVPLMDVEGFPYTGIVKVGVELIQYVDVDVINNNLIVEAALDPTDGYLVLQSNDQYYLPSPDNVGQGTINDLMLIQSLANETWTIKCIWVEYDPSNVPVPGTAKFQAFGSVSGSPLDGYGNYVVWPVFDQIVSNGVFSFSITETGPTFVPGDYFTIQVTGIAPGVSGGRGYDYTPITAHYINGWDGYHRWNPLVPLFTLTESLIYDNIYVCLSRFEYPNFPFTIIDGYRQVPIDYLSTDLAAADAANITFPMYDYAGYHRTDPVQLLNGTCVGSYIGGEMGCIDKFGNYSIYRGMSLQDQNTQRQDILLSVTGRPAVLIHRDRTGITCSCYLSTSEYPDDRCPFCYGTKFGYQQYFNPRRSDGRIMIRVSPTAENLKMHEAGLESEFPADMWTLTVPTIKTRDLIVLYDRNDNESFRYEVSDVTRNDTIIGLDGGQHLKTFRVRKTDPAYQIRIFSDTSDFPETLNTTLGFALGIPVHSHTIVINEKIVSVSQINQTTGIARGHYHVIVNGVVQPFLGHTHTIILP